MKKILSLLLFALPLACSGQEIVRDIFQLQLDRTNDAVQPEYIEMVVDKQFYFSGERLWYSLYVSDASYRTAQASAVAYVELRDKLDTVLVRQKVVCKKGMANGDIVIPKIWPSGSYKLVAYTLWMKNLRGRSILEHRLNILNPDFIYPSRPAAEAKRSEMDIRQLNDNEFRIRVDSTRYGNLLAMTREEVFYHQPVHGKGLHMLKCEQVNSHHLYVLLLDSANRIVETRALTTSNIFSRVRISMDRETVSPGEKIDFAVEIRDEAGNYMPAIFTVSARQAEVLPEVNEPEPKGLVEALLTKVDPKPLQFKKEVIIYPPTVGSLPAVNYSLQRVPVPFELTMPVDVNLERSVIRRKMIRSYGIEPDYHVDDEYNIPSNISFKPSNYAGIPDVEDFFREAVAMVKVRKVKGEKTLFVRNSDNPSNIYFFKQPPLMLVDGFIVTAEQLLSISLQDIEKLDVTWGSIELNSLNIFSIADNGIVSIVTKSKYPVPGATRELFKDFHMPAVFSQSVRLDDEDHLPRLSDPVYWQPNVYARDRTKFSFFANDEPGKILIRITGFTETGDHFSAFAFVTVKAGD
ncbi:MAG TPA: hypothetical protein VG737_16220 [Cyclobacteriaceae bacterium]|nr:hypothetical protein [Cyclobacteriaceae bacterium]